MTSEQAFELEKLQTLGNISDGQLLAMAREAAHNGTLNNFAQLTRRDTVELIQLARAIAAGQLFEKTSSEILDEQFADEHTYAEPDEAGLYPEARGARRPMGSKKVKAVVHTIELEQGFIGGWSVEWRGSEPTAAGEALSVRSTIYNAEREAIGAAAASIHAFVTSESFQLARIQGAAELKAVNSLISELIDLNPALSPLHAGAPSAEGNEARG